MAYFQYSEYLQVPVDLRSALYYPSRPTRYLYSLAHPGTSCCPGTNCYWLLGLSTQSTVRTESMMQLKSGSRHIAKVWSTENLRKNGGGNTQISLVANFLTKLQYLRSGA